MNKVLAALIFCLASAPLILPQHSAESRSECIDACLRERPNPDLQRQEVIALEKETARAVQLSDATFFRRVYSDDFSGVLSHGQTVDKAGLIAAVQSPNIKYDSFTASEVKVQLYRDTAVATCVWSMRAVFKGERISSQMRVMHIYIYGPGGYHTVSTQTTLLPPFPQQPL